MAGHYHLMNLATDDVQRFIRLIHPLLSINNPMSSADIADRVIPAAPGTSSEAIHQVYDAGLLAFAGRFK